MTKIDCPACGSRMVLRSSKRFGRSWYACPTGCDYRVSAHAETGAPMGTPADAATRAARSAAHAAFDRLWVRSSRRDRRGRSADGVKLSTDRVVRRHRAMAYAWLAAQLGIDKDECHIAMFDIDRCIAVVDVCGRASPNDIMTWGGK